MQERLKGEVPVLPLHPLRSVQPGLSEALLGRFLVGTLSGQLARGRCRLAVCFQGRCLGSHLWGEASHGTGRVLGETEFVAWQGWLQRGTPTGLSFGAQLATCVKSATNRSDPVRCRAQRSVGGEAVRGYQTRSQKLKLGSPGPCSRVPAF